MTPLKAHQAAADTIRRAKFPMLATVDAAGQPHLRPVSPVRVDGFHIYIANLRRYGKTAELAANPKCEICYLDDQHDQVRITGTALVLTDAEMLRSPRNRDDGTARFLEIGVVRGRPEKRSDGNTGGCLQRIRERERAQCFR